MMNELGWLHKLETKKKGVGWLCVLEITQWLLDCYARARALGLSVKR